MSDARQVGARCSVLARDAGEPLLGSAPHALVWVGVEQPGPWGPRPLQRPADSHLPGPVRELLAGVDARPGVKVLLLRRPGRHADTTATDPERQVLLAGVSPGHRFLVQTSCRSLDDVLSLDLPGSTSRALAGSPPPWGRPVDDPVTMVCTNGRRDRCCALSGREVATWLAQRRPGLAWECNHLGGHRYAPTSLVLPAGAVYGGLGGAALDATVDQLAGQRLPLTGLRGLSALSAEQQVADAAVRSKTGAEDLEATRVAGSEPHGEGATRVTVAAADGDWQVVVRRVAGPDRPESCAKPPVPRHDLVADTPVRT